jgi:hypothetical protein
MGKITIVSTFSEVVLACVFVVRSRLYKNHDKTFYEVACIADVMGHPSITGMGVRFGQE